MAKVTVELNGWPNEAASKQKAQTAAMELAGKALAAMVKGNGSKVLLHMTYEVLGSDGKPTAPGQQFVAVNGKVAELREKHVNYDVGTRRLFTKRIPLSLIENGDTLQPGAINIRVRKWFVDKEGLGGMIAEAL